MRILGFGSDPTDKNAKEDARIIEIAAGSDCCLARSEEGNVYSWGLGECGQLGRGRAQADRNGTLNTSDETALPPLRDETDNYVLS